MYRTHNCGELREEHAGEEVTLSGWVDSVRISGKIGFLLLRDRYGVTQCFLKGEPLEKASSLTNESVVKVEGSVKERPDEQKKSDMKTGGVELTVSDIEVLSKSDSLPLELDESVESTDKTRMKYRFLDLREDRMQENLELRHDVFKAVRDFFDERDFFEIETPLLAKSTPEGARDYLVPSRLNKGKFYALPQSPQLFKQLLMIGGYDKYFQIAKCFRDEDLRSDRQPEFTQLDVEMSFVEQEDLIQLIEELMSFVFKEVLNINLETPFPRITHKEAVDEYGTDKPHLGEEENGFHFCWVVDWPMFEESDDGFTYAHHPFTMPVYDEKEDIVDRPEDVKAHIHDLVLNGEEIAGGSIRCHDIEVQKLIFKALGLSKEEYEEKFGFFLEALQYGTPPHGGIAFGMDRLIALMAGEDSIRDVIAFPKTKDAEDLMLGTPSKVKKEQLDELGINFKVF